MEEQEEERYLLDKNMHRRNWLLVWKMEELGYDMAELSKKSGIAIPHLNKFMFTEEKENITKHCEMICKALLCQPRHLGWGLKFDTIRSPFRLDITAFKKVLTIQMEGLRIAHEVMEKTLKDVQALEQNILEANF